MGRVLLIKESPVVESPVVKASVAEELPVQEIVRRHKEGAGLASLYEAFPMLNDLLFNSMTIYDGAVPKPYSPSVTIRELNKVARIVYDAVDVFESDQKTVYEWFKNSKLRGIGKTPAALVKENKADLVLDFISAAEHNVFS